MKKNNSLNDILMKERFDRGSVKKKSKAMEVSRFISEGNPNIQEPGSNDKEEGNDEKQQKILPAEQDQRVSRERK